MPYFFTSGTAVAGGFEGHAYYMLPPSTTLTELTIPTGVQGMDVKPKMVSYRDRIYVFGQFSQNLIFNEFLQLHTNGIKAPYIIPTLAAGAGSGGSSGSAVGFITFAHKVGPYLIHESNPGGATAAVSLTGQGRAWSNIQTTSLDSRVTHVRGYVSMDGATARFAWERELATATVTENITTAALGVAIDSNRGVAPVASTGEAWHDRMWYVPPAFPDRIYFSEIEEPESVQETSYFPTRDGETITAVQRFNDQLLVFTRKSTYAIQGYTSQDFVFRKIHPAIGCIARRGCIDINGRIWFPSEDGVYVYDGSWTFAMKGLRDYWRDAYLANFDDYEDAEAGDDRWGHVYKLLVKQPSTPRSFYYVGHYENFEPSLGGFEAQPDWTFDIRDRVDECMGSLPDANTRRDQFYTGSCDSYVRKENDMSDSDDDGDTYGKAVTITYRHDYFDQIGGQEGVGKDITELNIYAKTENQALGVTCYVGEDEAPVGDAAFTGSIPASALSGSVAKTRHSINPGLAGEGLTLKLTATAPVGLTASGYGGTWDEGASERPSS